MSARMRRAWRALRSRDLRLQLGESRGAQPFGQLQIRELPCRFRIRLSLQGVYFLLQLRDGHALHLKG